MGRPSDYTDELLETICHRLSHGEPLAVICRDEGFPSDTTVRNWMNKSESVSCAIARARELGFDYIAWGARQTARQQGDSTDDVQRDKLIIDTDLKLLAKWDPKRYGDKIDHTHAGPGGGPVELTVHFLG